MKYGREKEIMDRKHFHSLAYMDDSITIWKLSICAQTRDYRNDLKIVDALDHILVVKIQFPRKVTTMQIKKIKTLYSGTE